MADLAADPGTDLFGVSESSVCTIGHGGAQQRCAHCPQPAALIHGQVQFRMGSPDTSHLWAGNRGIWARVLAKAAGSLGFISGFHSKKRWESNMIVSQMGPFCNQRAEQLSEGKVWC